jgi:hypothetical protein
MSVIITDADLHYVYKAFGYPIVTVDDIEIITEEAIKELVIAPTLEEYFRWFPIKEIQQVSISTGLTSGIIDFPDLDTYGVFRCQMAFKQDTDIYASIPAVTNPIFSSRYVQKSGGRRLGSRYDYGFSSIQKSTQWEIDSKVQANEVFYWRPLYESRQLEYYSTSPGWLEITWAKLSEDCSDVMFRYKRDFLDLCQAELKLYMVEFLTKVDIETPSKFDADNLKQEGQDKKDEIIEKWGNKTKAVISRA